MPRTIAIGVQEFADLREGHYFYIDKTDFIREWWSSGDLVTLITRPRRFGKTLNISMLECFFSERYAKRDDLFQGLSIWQDAQYRRLQGTYPVICLSFAKVKEANYEQCVYGICQILSKVYQQHSYLEESEHLTKRQRRLFQATDEDLFEGRETMRVYDALNLLSELLYAHTGKKPIILLDEYDTPMQEAYAHGFWDQIVSFIRKMFNAAFKTNPSLGRAIMTGITRVSKESIFSDLNNPKVITMTSSHYATAFGFTQKEVSEALEEFGLADQADSVKKWYDGFTFGAVKDIYNPWSIINYLDERQYAPYWANTSSNILISLLLQQANQEVKQKFEDLLQGKPLVTEIEEEIVFNRLEKKKDAIWSLMLSSGYLRVVDVIYPNVQAGRNDTIYTLQLTNLEVEIMFVKLIRQWFDEAENSYNSFIRALLENHVKEMNQYMNNVALTTFSYFDTGNRPTGAEPERFYHGFVLGLIVELADRYEILSNHESGFGRYDVMLIPKNNSDNAYIFEFKVLNPYDDEQVLADTAANALRQIKKKHYNAQLIAKGIDNAHIYHYGFAFQGKNVFIAKD